MKNDCTRNVRFKQIHQPISLEGVGCSRNVIRMTAAKNKQLDDLLAVQECLVWVHEQF